MPLKLINANFVWYYSCLESRTVELMLPEAVENREKHGVGGAHEIPPVAIELLTTDGCLWRGNSVFLKSW